LLALKIVSEPRITLVAAVGLAVGAMVWWSAVDEARSSTATASLPLGALVVVAGIVVAFGLLQGFGIGMMLLTAWPASAMALTSEREPNPTTLVPARCLQMLVFGCVLVLQRFFEQRYRADLRGVAITDYYALLGFLGGAMMPSLLSNLLPRSESSSPGAVAIRLIFVGVLCLAALTACMLLWGTKISFALFFGLALSMLILARAASLASQTAALLAMAFALALTEWTRHLLPLAELSHTERLRALSLVVVVLLILIVAGELATRFQSRGARRTATA
jgi:hypothetical protein